MKTSVLKVNVVSKKPIQAKDVGVDGLTIYKIDGSELLLKTSDKIDDMYHISFINLRDMKMIHVSGGVMLTKIGKLDSIEVTIENS